MNSNKSDFEERFTEYKHEASKAVHEFIIDTNKEIKTVGAAVESI